VSYFERKRQEGWKSAAAELGLEFFPHGATELQSQLSVFGLFQSGRARQLQRLIQGESDELVISIFDYRYTTGSGKSTHTYQQTVVGLRSQRLNVPAFSMRAENMLDKLGGLVGLADVDFESNPKFSSMFVLKGPNEEAIRSFFKPSILSFFENYKGLSVEAVAGAAIIYYPGKRVPPNEIKNYMSKAYEIYGVLVDR
jgi:hypothetical protein